MIVVLTYWCCCCSNVGYGSDGIVVGVVVDGERGGNGGGDGEIDVNCCCYSNFGDEAECW